MLRASVSAARLPRSAPRALVASGAAVLFAGGIMLGASGCGGGKKGAPATSASTMSTTSPSTPAKATKSYALKATLTAAAEVPKAKGAASASGIFSATITLRGKTGTLVWHLTTSRLSGAPIAAHVHLGPPGVAGPIAIPLCPPGCKPVMHGSFTGPIGGNVRLLHALLRGDAYVNVHTKLNPNGEIRGQIKATPTSATASPGTTTTVGTTTGSGY